jgi:hypothetical protein
LCGCAQTFVNHDSLLHYIHIMDLENPTLNTDRNLDPSEITDGKLNSTPATSSAVRSDDKTTDSMPATTRAAVAKGKKCALSMEPALQVAGKRIQRKSWKVAIASSDEEAEGREPIHPLFKKGQSF